MNKITKVALLSLIAIIQVSTLIGGFLAYEEMSQNIMRLQDDYKQLYEQTHELIIDYGIVANPFAPLFPLVLLGLFSTAGLLIDQLRHRTADSSNTSDISYLKT